MMDLASPVSAFVRECCVRGAAESVPADQLYNAWKAWTEGNGHHAGAKSTFGPDLRAVVPELKVTQPRANGGRERRYQQIGLQSWALNGDYPVPPVPDEPGTGYDITSTAAKAQVNGHGTGGTGTTPFKARRSGRTCPDCGRPGPAGHVRCRHCYQKRQTA